MSRQLRLEFPGAIWHVTSRGNERRDIFRDDSDRRRFVDLLEHVVLERRWLLHAWVLMPNHYHLLVETPEIGLSKGTKALNQEYATWFNDRHCRVGHLKGILVERETHLLELVRYLVLNPVRAGIVRFAGEYEWSNYRATAGLGPRPAWLEVEWTLRQCGGDEESYRRFVAAGRGASYDPRESLIGQIYLGSESFRDRMQSLVTARERSREHPCPQREWGWPDVTTLLALVCAEFGIAEATLPRKSRGPARKAFAQLAAEEGGQTFRTIAELLRICDSGAAKLRRAGRELYASDETYRTRIDRIRARL